MKGVSWCVDIFMSCVQYVLSFGGGSVMVCREMCGLRSVVVPFGDGSVMVCRKIVVSCVHYVVPFGDGSVMV